MCQLLAGTAYGQLLNLPLQVAKPKQKLIKHGELKKERINSIVTNGQLSKLFYSSQKHIYESSFSQPFQQQVYNWKYSSSNLIGMHILDQKELSIVVAFNDGAVKYLKKDSQGHYEQTNISQKKVQQDTRKFYKRIIDDKNGRYCLVGKDVLPVIYDSKKGVAVWNGKNVSNDYLDLKVQINDVDAIFFNGPNNLACANSQDKIRIYDVRTNKQRPSADYHLKLDKVYNKSYLTRLTANDSLFYVGNDLGAIYECDIRQSMRVIGKYKQINSTVTDLQIFEDKLFTSSLDCYVRGYDLCSKQLLNKYYMNKALYSLKVIRTQSKQTQQFQVQALSDEQEVLEQVVDKKMKKLRKRNKVQLNYLKEVNWDQVEVDPQLLKQVQQEYQQINQKDADRHLDDDNDQYQVKIKDQHDSDQQDSDLH